MSTPTAVSPATPGGATGPDPTVVDALARACAEFGADEVERLALFQAAIVASNLRTDGDDEERLGVLGQNRFWGPAVARRDPQTAALVFLKQARRLCAAGAPRSAARLASQVQGGPGVARHALARRTAERMIAGIDDVSAGAGVVVPRPVEA
ncbi:MAG TPA: hypothetical protein VGL04_04005 [Sporichthyaceae bacterium]|jgi:hypothetical protein